jgi:hypothetical protein
MADANVVTLAAANRGRATPATAHRRIEEKLQGLGTDFVQSLKKAADGILRKELSLPYKMSHQVS